MKNQYQPSQKILEKYADLLVNFALNGGKGVNPKEVVYLRASLSGLPLFTEVKKALIRSGAITIAGLNDDTSGMGKYFYENANDYQLTNFLGKYYRGLVDEIDHYIVIIGDHDPHELDKVDPKRIMLSQKSNKKLHDWMDAKENKGKFTWTLGLYCTPAMAEEAGLSLKEYWDQIIKGCYLDSSDPIVKWKEVTSEVQRVANKLSKLKIEWLHLTGKDADLRIKLGPTRKWMGGSGRNIPSFEVFTSPDWRGTEGWIKFNQPLYHYGAVIKDIELEFKSGRVIKSTASRNQKLLTEMLQTDVGASQVGEFSLTDKRLSRINKFMADTLFDENMGGKYGNTHIAVGKSYHETFTGNLKTTSVSQLHKLGFNDSAIHTDMVSTVNRRVVAKLNNGKELEIYNNGQFTV